MRINFAKKVAGEAALRLLSMAFVLLLARGVGPSDFGRYASAMAFASLFVIIVDLGTNFIVVREIVRHPEENLRIIGSCNFLKMVASFVAWTALHLASRIGIFPSIPVELTDALGVVAISYSLTDYFAALLSGKEEMGWEAALKALSRALIVSGGLLALYKTHSLRGVVIAMAWGAALSLIAGGGFIGARFHGFRIWFDRAWLSILVQGSLPLFGSVVFWLLYDSQDILLLNYFHIDNIQIGWFSAAMKIIEVLRVFPILLSSVFFPALSRLGHDSTTAFAAKARSLIKWAILSFPFTVGPIYLLAPTLIGWMYGPHFLGAAPLLRVLLPAYCGIAINHVALHLLIARNYEKQIPLGAILTCVLNFILCWLWIPRFGPVGVAYALWASEAFYFFYQFRLILLHIPGLATWKAEL